MLRSPLGPAVRRRSCRNESCQTSTCRVAASAIDSGPGLAARHERSKMNGVEDHEAGVTLAIAAGGRVAPHQAEDSDPRELRVMLDPAGHPLLLVRSGSISGDLPWGTKRPQSPHANALRERSESRPWHSG
jgi:hypothetical protein